MAYGKNDVPIGWLFCWRKPNIRCWVIVKIVLTIIKCVDGDFFYILIDVLNIYIPVFPLAWGRTMQGWVWSTPSASFKNCLKKITINDVLVNRLYIQSNGKYYDCRNDKLMTIVWIWNKPSNGGTRTFWRGYRETKVHFWGEKFEKSKTLPTVDDFCKFWRGGSRGTAWIVKMGARQGGGELRGLTGAQNGGSP